MQGAVANLIYCFSMFEGILFETTDLGISAAHHSDDQVGYLADIENRIWVISVDLKEDETLLAARHIRGAGWVRA